MKTREIEFTKQELYLILSALQCKHDKLGSTEEENELYEKVAKEYVKSI